MITILREWIAEELITFALWLLPTKDSAWINLGYAWKGYLFFRILQASEYKNKKDSIGE